MIKKRKIKTTKEKGGRMQKISFTGYIPTSNFINTILKNNINKSNQAKQNKAKQNKENQANKISINKEYNNKYEFNQNKNEQQTNEKTQLKGRKFYREIIIRSVIETAKINLDASTETILNAVIKRVEEDFLIKKTALYSNKTYLNDLKQRGFSREPKKGQRKEIKNIKIVLP